MKNCILIVDVQNGFINESTEHIPALVEKLQDNYDYIYVTRFFNKKDSFYRKLVKWDRFDKDSNDFQLAFKPSPKAIIINKSTYSCVIPSFLQELNKNKIQEVDICGIDTDICVTKCAVDLFESGIVPKVLSKYCASHAGLKSHKSALSTLRRYIGKDQVIADHEPQKISPRLLQ